MSLPVHRLDGPSGAPLLVLANSLGTTIDLWEPQLATLAQHFRILRFEYPGHSGAPVPEPTPRSIAELALPVVALLDHLGEERASVCGISLGGMVAMWLASHRPDRVNRLVLACTAARLPPSVSWTERATAVLTGGVGSLLETSMVRWFTSDHLAQGRLRPRAAAMLESCDAEGYAACCLAIGAMDQRDDLAAITAPTLVIAGADDPVTPPAMGLELVASIPGAGMAVLPNAAHLANLEQPVAFTSAIIDHLAGTGPARGDRARRSVLGDAHVDRTATTGPLRQPFFDYVTANVWGAIWSRPGIDLRTRSAITLALLAAVGAWVELGLHVRAARRIGLTEAEIGEILLHTGVYAGVPTANKALSIAEGLLDEDRPVEDQPHRGGGPDRGPDPHGGG